MSSLALSFGQSSLILTPEKLRYNPCNDLIFPSVIRTQGLVEQPLGNYYLYYAPHDAPGGICLAYADAPDGPWTEYAHNPILTRQWAPYYDVSHISSPHVLWMPHARKFFLYFHGENDTTRAASSSDGIHFAYEGIAVATSLFDGISEASYARVFPYTTHARCPGYVLLFMGNNQGTRRIYAAWSYDGLTFEPQRQPLLSPPPGTGVTQVGGPWYFPRDGKNYVVFHGDKTSPDLSDVTTDLYLAEVGPDFTEEIHHGLLYPRQSFSDDNARVSDPCFFQQDNTLWLFMAVGPRLRQTIALARATPKG